MSESSILVPVPESLAAKLLVESTARGITIAGFINEMYEAMDPEDLRPKSITYSSQMEEALARAERIPTGQHFTLARLFPNDWDTLPSPTAFGRLFRKELRERGIAKDAGRDNTAKMARYEKL